MVLIILTLKVLAASLLFLAGRRTTGLAFLAPVCLAIILLAEVPSSDYLQAVHNYAPVFMKTVAGGAFVWTGLASTDERTNNKYDYWPVLLPLCFGVVAMFII